jgi:serine/threonine-protein kinase
MLFEMLAGRRPFEQKQAAAMVYAIINDSVPDLTELRPDAPPALAHLIQQMLAKVRDQRIRSVRQVGAELEEIMREIDTGIQPDRGAWRSPGARWFC